MRYLHVVRALIAVIALAGCSPSRSDRTVAGAPDSVRADSAARARQDSANRAQPGYVVDSAIPPAEELRRFRNAVGGAPATALSGGSSSREELARRLVRAVERRDTADLRTMSLSAREFADLVYPGSRYSKPPYRQGPAFMWAEMMRPSITGFGRIMSDRGGKRYEYQGVLCRATPDTEGANRIWSGCALWLVSPAGDTITESWFESIIERAGQFKIVSYANRL